MQKVSTQMLGLYKTVGFFFMTRYLVRLFNFIFSKKGVLMWINLFELFSRALSVILYRCLSLIYFITSWYAGFLTNWKVVRRRKIQWFLRIKKIWYNKKIKRPNRPRKRAIRKHLLRKEQRIVLLKKTRKKPDFIIVVNPNYHRNVISEANKSGIPVLIVAEFSAVPKLLGFLKEAGVSLVYLFLLAAYSAVEMVLFVYFLRALLIKRYLWPSIRKQARIFWKRQFSVLKKIHKLKKMAQTIKILQWRRQRPLALSLVRLLWFGKRRVSPLYIKKDDTPDLRFQQLKDFRRRYPKILTYFDMRALQGKKVPKTWKRNPKNSNWRRFNKHKRWSRSGSTNSWKGRNLVNHSIKKRSHLRKKNVASL